MEISLDVNAEMEFTGATLSFVGVVGAVQLFGDLCFGCVVFFEIEFVSGNK